jgi:polyferredoxin
VEAGRLRDVRRVTTHSILLRSIDMILVDRLFLYTLFHLLQGQLGLVVLVLRSKPELVIHQGHRPANRASAG